MLNGVNGNLKKPKGAYQLVNGSYKLINGMQHIGIGVFDIDRSWKWYRRYFGLDIPFFDAVAEAPLMQYYNCGNVIEKRAAMVMNLQGGCAVEVIQPTSFVPQKADFTPQLGDLGIFMARVKTTDLQKSHNLFKEGGEQVSNIMTTPDVSVLFM